MRIRIGGEFTFDGGTTSTPTSSMASASSPFPSRSSHLPTAAKDRKKIYGKKRIERAHWDADGPIGLMESGPSRITIDDLQRMEEGPRSNVRGRSRRRVPRHDRAEAFDLVNNPSCTDTSTTRTTRRRNRIRGNIALPIGLGMLLLPIASAAPPLAFRPTPISTRTITYSQPTPTLIPIPTQINPSSEIASAPSLKTYLRPPSQHQFNPRALPAVELGEPDHGYDLQYLTSASQPTTLPTDIYLVPETRLPYYLSQMDDGTWSKMDNAWNLYGRRPGIPTQVLAGESDPSATAVPTSVSPTDAASESWAVSDALPKGWGVSASRSDFYKTPLIAVASVILAVAIVAGIIFIVISRRKAHRRAKRRAAKTRRKALAAAGISENDPRAGVFIENELRDKLTELEKSQRKKKQRGPTTLVKTKVKGWKQGLRRRKGKGDNTEDSTDGSINGDGASNEKENADHEHQTNDSPSAPRPSLDSRRSTGSIRVSQAASASLSDRSGTRPRPQHRDSGSASGSAEMTGNGSLDDPASSSLTTTLVPTGSNEGSSTSAAPPAVTVTAAAPYFPPAYRPASVRSLAMYESTSSSSRPSNAPSHPSSDSGPGGPGGSSQPVVLSSATEKTTAPGYYPAPATEESENALAVVSRADGKSRMPSSDVAPSDEQDEAGAAAIRHIATDDKRVLERMMMGASQPTHTLTPGVGVTEEGSGTILSSGPSAPAIEIDEEGFERPSEEMIAHAQPTSPSQPSAPPGSLGDIPAPPQPAAQRSFRTYDHDDLAVGAIRDEVEAEDESDPSSDLHLLPSAPPPPAHPDHQSLQSVEDGSALALDGPSAPPMLPDDQDEEDDQHSTPSAPPLSAEETVVPALAPAVALALAHEDGPGSAPIGNAVGVGASPSPSLSPAGRPMFLPKYEP